MAAPIKVGKTVMVLLDLLFLFLCLQEGLEASVLSQQKYTVSKIQIVSMANEWTFKRNLRFLTTNEFLRKHSHCLSIKGMIKIIKIVHFFSIE